VIYSVLVEPPQELTKETSLVRGWIELKIKKSLAFLVQVKIAANWIRKLKSNVDKKFQKITNIIFNPHPLITAYEHIKSKLRNMTPRGDDEQKTFLGRGRKPFFSFGINRRWFEPFFSFGINRRWFEHTAIVCIVDNFVINWQMNNNANNLFEHIKQSPYFSKRLEDMNYTYIYLN
jgi:hypothetical protein